MKVLIISVGLLIIQGVVSFSNPDIRQAYRKWVQKYHSDSLQQSPQRYNNFVKTYREVERLNSEEQDWKAGLNLFADMTESERNGYLGLKNMTEHPTDVEEVDETVLGEALTSVPREKFHEMGSVVNQGSCGSCWAFAAVAALEGHLLLHHHEYKELSEQYIVDCAYQRDGCDGGHSTTAINTVYNSKYGSRDYGYIPLRKDLPYQKSSDYNRCLDKTGRRLANALTRAKPRGIHVGLSRDDKRTELNIATRGPVVVYVYASWAMQLYLFGTFNGVGCGTNPTPNHAVTAAGYTQDYWYIKNSWGTWWGRGGYLHLSRGWSNLCSVSAYNIVPQWNVNKNYDICSHTHPWDRQPCVDDGNVGPDTCQAMGCCYDGSQKGIPISCFTKSMVTVWYSNIKRVYYKSLSSIPHGDATKIEVNEGTFIVYNDKNFEGSKSKIVSQGETFTSFPVRSLRPIPAKNSITLFEHFNYMGHKATLSKDNNKLQHVSSVIANGNYNVCTENGKCAKLTGETRQPQTLLCNDCIRSVKFI